MNGKAKCLGINQLALVARMCIQCWIGMIHHSFSETNQHRDSVIPTHYGYSYPY